MEVCNGVGYTSHWWPVKSTQKSVQNSQLKLHHAQHIWTRSLLTSKLGGYRRWVIITWPVTWLSLKCLRFNFFVITERKCFQFLFFSFSKISIPWRKQNRNSDFCVITMENEICFYFLKVGGKDRPGLKMAGKLGIRDSRGAGRFCFAEECARLSSQTAWCFRTTGCSLNGISGEQKDIK